LRYFTRSFVFAAATFMTVVVIQAASVLPQKQPVEKDIPSVARDALKSVVVVETKDGLGKLLTQGSGFVVSRDGEVVTNYHVIQGAASAEVRFPDGASYLVEGLLASNPERDLVVLKIRTTSNEFRFLILGDSDRVELGEEVVAIGSPLGLEATVSPGFISGVREVNGLELLQTTAPISPGNSGGALVNLAGEVVGVPTLSLTSVRENATVTQNLNFALPSNYVRELVNGATKEVSSLTTSAVVHSKPELSDRSLKEIVGSAKTLCVLVLSGNPVLKTELSGKLVEWGKLKLVSSQEDADLLLKVVQTGELNLATGAGNQATALLVDRTSGTELWSKTKGGSWAMSGYSNAWVARALASDFIKFFESASRQSRK
jgi:S1-C subfamily serine protease